MCQVVKAMGLPWDGQSMTKEEFHTLSLPFHLTEQGSSWPEVFHLNRRTDGSFQCQDKESLHNKELLSL